MLDEAGESGGERLLELGQLDAARDYQAATDRLVDGEQGRGAVHALLVLAVDEYAALGRLLQRVLGLLRRRLVDRIN